MPNGDGESWRGSAEYHTVEIFTERFPQVVLQMLVKMGYIEEECARCGCLPQFHGRGGCITCSYEERKCRYVESYKRVREEP